MMPEHWYICPIWFIPSFFLWACLFGLCDHYHITERLSKRYGWRKRKVQKWLGRILGAISLIVTLAILTVISGLIGFDLLNWEWI